MTVAASTSVPARERGSGEDHGGPLFPLPLTPLEYYFLRDHRDDYPATFPIRLEWHGHVDRELLELAFVKAQQRHPLLTARVDSSGRWPQWVEGPPASVIWNDDGPTYDEFDRLADSGAVQAYFNDTPDGVSTQFVFHHSAVDGLGAFVFVKDFLIAFEQLNPGGCEPPKLPRLHTHLLARRDEHVLSRDRVGWRDLFRLTTISARVLFQRPAVAQPGDSPRPDGPLPAVPDYTVDELTEAETVGLAELASARGIMLHDLLLRDLFITLRDWAPSAARGRQPLRVLVPTNLRRGRDYRMPAANLFSYVFMTRHTRALEDRSALLASISDEMNQIKEERRGRYFEAGLRLFCLWPPLLHLVLKRRWPFATAVFSNLGTSFDNLPFPGEKGNRTCGQLRFLAGSGAALIRRDTRCAFAVHGHEGRLGVSLRCDPRWFSKEQQRELLMAYLGQLRKTLELGT